MTANLKPEGKDAGNAWRTLLLAISVPLILLSLAVACNGDDDGADAPSPTANPNDSAAPGTPAPADPSLARDVFTQFVTAVQDNELERAWELYIASVPGDFEQHNAGRGCDFAFFTLEFPKMQNMFERIAPFEVIETFSGAGLSPVVEVKLSGADGNDYLTTLLRDPPDSEYRVQFLNKGRPSEVPGVPDPFPSPEDPQGFCAIWTGPR